MEFSRQEYWSGLPFPFPWDPPDLGIEPRSPALQADALPSEPLEKPIPTELHQIGIKIAGRNIDNLRYADVTTLMDKSEEKLKNLLMKVRVKKLA